MTDTRIDLSDTSRLRQRTALALVSVGVALAVGLLALPELRLGSVVAGLALYAAVGAAVLDRVVTAHPFPYFGLANGITLARAAGAATLLGLLASRDLLLQPQVAWAALALALGLLLLDGLDGWAARRQRLCSRFGARFDMEVDAILILVLTGFALALGKAGAWVLAIGLIRYAFVAAGLIWSSLQRDLPPSLWRKVVCVLQIVVLTALLAPPVTPPVSSGLAAIALAALIWSFGRDVRWLIRQPS